MGLFELSEEKSMGYLDLIPEFLLFKIFKMLNQKDLLRISLVCKDLYVYANDEEIWKV